MAQFENLLEEYLGRLQSQKTPIMVQSEAESISRALPTVPQPSFSQPSPQPLPPSWKSFGKMPIGELVDYALRSGYSSGAARQYQEALNTGLKRYEAEMQRAERPYAILGSKYKAIQSAYETESAPYEKALGLAGAISGLRSRDILSRLYEEDIPYKRALTEEISARAEMDKIRARLLAKEIEQSPLLSSAISDLLDLFGGMDLYRSILE